MLSLVKLALLRVEADALAYYMRKGVHLQRTKLKHMLNMQQPRLTVKKSNSEVQRNANDDSDNGNNGMCMQLVQKLRSKLAVAQSIMHEAGKTLKKTSNDIGRWRIEVSISCLGHDACSSLLIEC